MVTLVDPQEADLELQPVDRLVDVVRQPGVEDVVVVAANQVRLLRGDGDVAESACAGDESAAGYLERKHCSVRGRVNLLGETVGPGEAKEALNAAQLGVIIAAFDGRHAVIG